MCSTEPIKVSKQSDETNNGTSTLQDIHKYLSENFAGDYVERYDCRKND